MHALFNKVINLNFARFFLYDFLQFGFFLFISTIEWTVFFISHSMMNVRIFSLCFAELLFSYLHRWKKYRPQVGDKFGISVSIWLLWINSQFVPLVLQTYSMSRFFRIIRRKKLEYMRFKMFISLYFVLRGLIYCF
jgi:hypothetical protein